MGRRKLPRSPHEDTGGAAKTNENAILSTIFGLSARREFGAAKSARTAGQEAPRPAQEPPKSRQNRSREAARAIQDGPGAVHEEPGAARSRPGSVKTAPEPPKTAPRARHNGFRGAEAAGGPPGLCFGACESPFGNVSGTCGPFSGALGTLRDREAPPT